MFEQILTALLPAGGRYVRWAITTDAAYLAPGGPVLPGLAVKDAMAAFRTVAGGACRGETCVPFLLMAVCSVQCAVC